MRLISDSFAQTPATSSTVEPPIPVEKVAAQVDPQNLVFQNLLFLFLLFSIFYFILIRPQQKKLRAHQEMVKSLGKGSKVMTAGGIIGTVSSLEGDDIAVVEIAQGVKVKIARATIQEIVKGTGAAKTANDN